MNLPSILTMLGIASLAGARKSSGSRSLSIYDLIRINKNNGLIDVIDGRSLRVQLTEDLYNNRTTEQSRRILLSEMNTLISSLKKVMQESDLKYYGLDKLEVRVGGWKHTSWHSRNKDAPSLINQELIDKLFDLISSLQYKELAIIDNSIEVPDRVPLRSPVDFRVSRSCKTLLCSAGNSQILEFINGMSESIFQTWQGAMNISPRVYVEKLHIWGWHKGIGLANLDLSGIKKLKDLSLNIQQLRDVILPKSIESVKIRNFKGKRLPDAVMKARNLKMLSFWSSNSHFSCEIDFSKCPNIECIEIVANPGYPKRLDTRSTINPKMIDVCRKIETIILNGIGLDSIPENIADLPILTNLNVTNNLLETLPSSLFDRSHISVLKIKNNRFLKLPKSFWISLLSSKMNIQMFGQTTTWNPLGKLEVPNYEQIIRELQGRRVYARGRNIYLKLKAMRPQSQTNIRRY